MLSLLELLCMEIGIIFFLLGITSILMGWRFRNFLSYLIALELLFLGLNIEFALSSFYLDDISGVLFVLFFLVIIAAEAAIAFSILISFYRLKNVKMFFFIKTIPNKNRFFYKKLGYIYDFDVETNTLWS